VSEESLLASVVSVQDVGLGVRALDAGSSTEVFESLTLSGTSEEDGIFAEGSDFRKLIEGEDFTTGLDDSAAGLFGDAQGADSELGDGEQSLVIEDVANNDQDLFLLLGSVGVLGQLGNGNRIAGGAALVQALVDDLVELRLGSSAQEFVELDQESVIQIGGGGVSANLRLNSASLVQVDAHSLAL